MSPTRRIGKGRLAWAATLLVAGCASRVPAPLPPTAPETGAPPARTTLPAPRPVPLPPPAPVRDGPEPNPPPGLMLVPDAEPTPEAPRVGGPNKPYEVDGTVYVPLPAAAPLKERGLASWYGRKFHGRSTASGERYDMYAMSAAHRTMPLPSYAKVRNPANGKEVVVRVNDRGPFHRERIIDLSYTAALKLGLLAGVGPVEVERITPDAVRAGTWKAPPTAAGKPVQPEPAGGVADPMAAPDPIGDLARRALAAPGR